MATVLIARNGIGLGHLSRSIALGETLERMGERPLLFAEGQRRLAVPHTFPTIRVTKREMNSDKNRRWLERQVSTSALLSTPSIVFEDTHSLGLEISNKITRVMVLRPIEFAALKRLKQFLDEQYDCILVADDPNSPTWPYGSKATLTLRTWDNWRFIGPIYRTPTEKDIRRVKKRYGWRIGRRICVFSLGGGGEHEGANDATEFIDRGVTIAQGLLRVDPEAQMIFVKGPLFGRKHRIPSIFRIVDQEALMPALFGIADAAVIRPGFNSIWECISGETAILPILGTSFQEPMKARIARLKAQGLVVDDLKTIWGDTAKLSSIASTCREITTRYSGSVSPDAIRSAYSVSRSVPDFVDRKHENQAENPNNRTTRQRLSRVSPG